MRQNAAAPRLVDIGAIAAASHEGALMSTRNKVIASSVALVGLVSAIGALVNAKRRS